VRGRLDLKRCAALSAVGLGLYGCSAIENFSGLIGDSTPGAATDGGGDGGTIVGAVDAATDDDAPATMNGDASSDADAGGDAGVRLDAGADAATAPHAVKTVFVITMTHFSQSAFMGSSSAPYLTSLVSTSATATNYSVVLPAIGYAEPHMIWFEAGDSLGITDDSAPTVNHQATTSHFVDELEAAGVTWKSYQEDIGGTTCPLTDTGAYIVHHNPFAFFDDVTNQNDVNAARCIAHVRPYTQLATDLSSGMVARYNYIVPNVCHDMHDDCSVVDGGTPDPVARGDKWLSTEVPKIIASNAYKNGGAIMIVWDYTSNADTTTPFFLISSLARTGHASAVPYTHSSLLKTVSEIFSVAPIRGAADATTNDLSDLFTTFP
jgi:hypothetical protein